MNGLLKSEIKNDVLTMSISIESLIGSIESGALDISYGGEVTITNTEEFKASFKNELMRESEDGTTPVHQMFDDVAGNCIENGERGIDVKET